MLSDSFKITFVAIVAGLFAFCLGAVVVAALGWPIGVSAFIAGAGAGAAAVRVAQRLREAAAER
ncbi:MAG: hypothetical protein ACLFQ5_11740 [Oceanicaulis sp.]